MQKRPEGSKCSTMACSNLQKSLGWHPAALGRHTSLTYCGIPSSLHSARAPCKLLEATFSTIFSAPQKSSATRGDILAKIYKMVHEQPSSSSAPPPPTCTSPCNFSSLETTAVKSGLLSGSLSQHSLINCAMVGSHVSGIVGLKSWKTQKEQMATVS